MARGVALLESMMDGATGPRRIGVTFVVGGMAVALLGAVWLAFTTVGVRDLGRPTPAADAEGPGLVAMVAALGERIAASEAGLRATNGPPLPGVIAPASTSTAGDRYAQQALREQFAGELEALRAGSTAGASRALILEASGVRGLDVVLRAGLDLGDFRYFGGAGVRPTAPGVQRIEGALHDGASTLIFVTPLSSAGSPPTRWAYVFYDHVLLLNPAWQPLQNHAVQAALALGVLLLGAVAATLGWRRRRWERAVGSMG